MPAPTYVRRPLGIPRPSSPIHLSSLDCAAASVYYVCDNGPMNHPAIFTSFSVFLERFFVLVVIRASTNLGEKKKVRFISLFAQQPSFPTIFIQLQI
jgi:hypothetical protein